MRNVICYVDLDLRSPDSLARTKVFQNLCTLLMLLKVVGNVELKCTYGSARKRVWSVNWSEVESGVSYINESHW